MYYLSFKLKSVLYLFMYIIYFKQFIYLAIKPFLNVVLHFFFFIKVSVPAPFRHRYRFKSIGYVPVSDKKQTIPIPTPETSELQPDEDTSPPAEQVKECARTAPTTSEQVQLPEPPDPVPVALRRSERTTRRPARYQ